MQNLAKDEAGNVWEIDASGNPVRIHQQSAAPARGRVFTLPQSPKEQKQEARADEDQQMQREAAARAERAAQRADNAAQRQAAAAERTANAASKPTEFQSKSAGFLGRMMEAERDFGAVPASERGARSVPRQFFHNVAPGIENSLVNSSDRQKADQAVENFIAASLRQESGASISPVEFERQYKIFYPAPGDSEETIKQKAAARAQAVQAFRLAAGPLADAAASSVQRADNEVPNPTTGADLKPPAPGLLDPSTNPGGDVQTSVATGPTHQTHDPRLSAQVDAMMNAGASFATINAVLKRQNFPPLRADQFNEALKWMKANPGKKYFGADVSRVEDMNLLQRAAGSPVGTFLGHLGNMGAAGIPAALAGPSGQGALDASAALHPDAAGLGDIAGNVTGMAGAEAAIAGRAPAALARYAPRIADTLYGGLQGFNTARDGEGGMGALKGAGGGLVGGYLGNKALSGAGRVVRGVVNPHVQHLRGLDIPLTVGQTLGGTWKKVEDALTSLPLVGNMVDARRMEGLRGFNRAAFREAGAPIGANVTATGAGGINQLRDQVGNAYRNTLDPVSIDPTDPHFGADLQEAIGAAGSIPNVNSAQDAALAGLQNRIDGAIDPVTGDISGRGFQEAYRGLARTGRERAGSDYGHEVGQAMRQGQDALAGALERQNPGAFDAFRAANSTNRNVNVLGDAVNRAKNAEDQLFTPAQLNMVDDASTRRLAGSLASAAGNRPFHDLATHGQAVLPSKLPDSGTWTRAIVGGGLTGVLGAGGGMAGGTEGAGIGTGAGLGTTLLLAAGGSRPAQRVLTATLTHRPDLLRQFGEILIQNARLGGTAGAGTGLALTAP